MEYVIKKAEAGANLADFPQLQITYPYKNTPDYIKASARIAYNDEALLVHMELEAPEVLSQEEGTLGHPCRDSCMEFFFSPIDTDSRYLNIEFNFGGCVYFGMGDGKGLTRFTIGDPHEYLKYKSVRTEKGYYMDYEVPYGLIRRFFPGFAPYSGKKMMANCYSCAERTQVVHYLSWSPIDDKKFSFHRPECFGTMIFE